MPLPTMSHITLPSGNTYEIKDAYARELLTAGIQFVICYDGTAAPVVANIPAGVTVKYNETEYTGTMPASSAEPLHFYLVLSPNSATENVYSEYVSIRSGSSEPYTYSWELLGDTSLDLSSLGALAYKDNVTLSKGSGDNVLGSDATFTTTVTPTKKKYKATASGGTVGVKTTDTFVKSYPGVTSKLVKGSVSGVKTNTSKTIPNVTSVGSASTWGFAMGTGADAETLIISGGNGSAPTLGTAISASLIETESKDFATGALAANGAGDSVMTGLGAATTGTAATAVEVTAQPSVALAEDNNGDIEVVADIASASTQTNSKDEVKVAKYIDLSVSVS